MWTLGVTLFTLVFFENPFKDADDIINGHLNPPFAVSSRKCHHVMPSVMTAVSFLATDQIAV